MKQEHLLSDIAAHLGVSFESYRPVSGGDTHPAIRATSKKGGDFFIKLDPSGSTRLLSEAKSLGTLAKACPGSVPEVLMVSKEALVMPYYPKTRAGPEHMATLARNLARIHRDHRPNFGFFEDNFIGGSPQPNPLVSYDGDAIAGGWGEYYFEHRLWFQISLLKANRRRKGELPELMQALKPIVLRLTADAMEPPCLMHGDLWEGNFLVAKKGVFFIDPASYYGHRELDLAMTYLFGGFSAGFYAAYEECLPLQEGFSDRLPLYQLYHILNHYNLFGGPYGQRAYEIISELLRRHGSSSGTTSDKDPE